MYRKYIVQLNNKYIRYNSISKHNLSNYSNTIILPKTKFPQKLAGKKLTDQNKHIYETTGFNDLYSWQKSNLNGPEFILHDGPPYANGLPHMGHAINKILKDVINRQQVISGNKVHYIPGWDCHGLPIELKALSKSKKSNNTPIYIRETARDFAKKTIGKQREIFQSWGIMADWNNSYLTFSILYIKNQLKQFYKLYDKKLIYRDVKPVYWSPSSRTALAEAELEYNPKHKSTAIIVRFKLNNLPQNLQKSLPSNNSQIYALIWTTTPWTLPSNQAICFNPKLSYSFVESDDLCIYLIATDLVENVSQMIQKDLKIISTFKGDQLENTTYIFPFDDNIKLPFLAADHATASKGTGLVHTAPAHGPDDFIVALNYNIPVKCIVNESGCYSEDCKHFKNLSVLKEGNTEVINYLKDNVLNISDYIHSYPYDWRTKKPVIIRASQQWFIDTNSLKDRAIELVQDVKIYPEKNSEIYKNNLISQLKKRPYWCISRQRVWGVPIPVFYNKTNNEPIINQSLINHLCNLLESKGTDFWWTLTLNELFPTNLLNELNLNISDVIKGEDILDIWFDSGISWSSVLGDDKIANMYLEGVDQFTGWFQSSLMTSVALRDKAPYKSIYVHGFAVDENGHKMSKSLENVIDPQNIINGGKKQQPLGIDTLRWWVVCHASQNSTEFISQNILQASSDEVQKIRNTLRFALGNLNDVNPDVSNLNFNLIDRYLLHLLYEFDLRVTEMYKNYQFNKLCITIINFITNPVSALYYSIIKDRLYCESLNDSSRQSAQFVLNKILTVVSKAISPITPYLVEELYMYRNIKDAETFFKSDYKNCLSSEFYQPELAKIVENILNIRKDINKIGNMLELNVDLEVSSEFYKQLQIIESKDELTEILQVANINIKTSDKIKEENYSITPSKTKNFACLRCKRFNSTIENELCKRCSIVSN